MGLFSGGVLNLLFATKLLSKKISPFCISSKPAMTLIKVVFPQPEGPKTETIELLSIENFKL
jgi:hypothetical protein